MIRTAAEPARVWTTAEIGDLFARNKHKLSGAARRIVGDSSKAEEIVQDALLKVLIASPELPTEDSALAYLRLSVKNLCLDHLRKVGKSPRLVVLSDVESADDFAELSVPDFSDEFEKAEDAALIREALSLLSPAQRAALVMWEIEGRSSEEIASELGISRSSVRHLLSRARKSLRELLTNRIIDEQRGLTTMDILRGLGDRGIDLSKKVSKSALVLFVAFGLAFFLPNAFTTDLATENNQPGADEVVTKNSDSQGFSSFTPQTDTTAEVPKTENPEMSSGQDVKSPIQSMNLVGSNLPALNAEGVPTGFSVAFDDAAPQPLVLSNVGIERTEDGLNLVSTVSTRSGPYAILFDQLFTLDAFGLGFKVNVVAGIGSEWVPLDVSAIETLTERLPSGDYMVSARLKVRGVPSRYISLALPSEFNGLDRRPSQIALKVVLDPSKTQILAQSVWVSGTSQGDRA